MKRITYQNPVWSGYFADPFVLRTGDGYYAYGTGPAAADGRQFPVLRSADLSHWESVGGALVALSSPPASSYWAPEVMERAGRYYLYYSASTTGFDQDQRLRVAIADHPAGPFIDSGRVLLDDAMFSIDASPFRDPADGSFYLFFAMDYLSDEPTGTGLAVVPLADDLITVTAEPRVVVRASASWHVYERDRAYKDRIWPVWSCVEGPSVIAHDGRYYCLYSGGNWQGENYGVGYAVALTRWGHGPMRRPQGGPSVLKGIGNSVIGPGHNSLTLGPDGRTTFIVYHAWDAARTARRMFIDALHFTPEGPRADGPTTDKREIIVEQA